MSWVAVAIGTGTVVGGIIGANAAQGAADTQASAARRASDIELQMFNQTRADQQPWREAGGRALAQMENPDFQRDFGMSDFQADPGYAFRMQEGQKALERSAAAKGGLMSGGTLKAISRYGQDVASGEYQNAYNRFNNDRTNRFNRLSSLAGIGQTANSQVGAAGQNYANQVGQNITGAANAQAAGQVGQANAINNGIAQGTNTWMQYQFLNRMKPPATGISG